MDGLSDELLLHVFSYLDALSLCKVKRVCHRFHELSTDEILWKHKLIEDVTNWKNVTNGCLAKNEISKLVYLKESPDIRKCRRIHYEQTTVHHLADFLKQFLPMKRYLLGAGASAMDSYGKGHSFIGRLLSSDSANIFQHCGQFPGKFRGHGSGFLLKFKRSMLELSLIYVAPKQVRDVLTFEEKLQQLDSKMKQDGCRELMSNLHGYIHTIDCTKLADTTVEETIQRISCQAKEIDLISCHLKKDAPLLILATKKQDSDPSVSPFHISRCLNLPNLNRPWMVWVAVMLGFLRLRFQPSWPYFEVASLTSQMIYRDIEDPMDWLLAKCSN